MIVHAERSVENPRKRAPVPLDSRKTEDDFAVAALVSIRMPLSHRLRGSFSGTAYTPASFVFATQGQFDIFDEGHLCPAKQAAGFDARGQTQSERYKTVAGYEVATRQRGKEFFKSATIKDRLDTKANSSKRSARAKNSYFILGSLNRSSSSRIPTSRQCHSDFTNGKWLIENEKLVARLRSPNTRNRVTLENRSGYRWHWLRARLEYMAASKTIFPRAGLKTRKYSTQGYTLWVDGMKFACLHGNSRLQFQQSTATVKR